jgi:hypothetical protein
MTEKPISVEVSANDKHLQFWYLAYRYQGAPTAAAAWETAQASPFTELSAFRLQLNGEWLVAVLSEDEETVSSVAAMIAENGQRRVLPEDVVFRLFMRRARQVVENDGSQVARYPKEGRELDLRGRDRRPRRR